jgi:uncharacterized membrane protein
MTIKSRVLAMALGLGLASTVSAADGQEQRGQKTGRGGPDIATEVMSKVRRAMSQLDLSEEQRTAIREEVKGIREEIRPLVKELHVVKSEMRESMLSGEYDADAVAGIADRQGAITSEISILVSSTVAAAMAHLSEEQRLELSEMRENAKSHRKEHRQMRGEHRKERRQRRTRETAEDS